MSFDSERFRIDSRERWERASPGWATRREAFQAGAAPVSSWLVEAIAPQPGHVVLELAAGPGDTGLMAAELVSPGGKVLITDGAPGMVAAAAERIEELGAHNAEASAMEAEWIDLPTASVDGVLMRWGLMLLADPETALREIRRVLRPGGRAAFAVWAAKEHNPIMAEVTAAAIETGALEPPADEDAPGPFRLTAQGLDTLFDATGFLTWEVEPLDLEWAFASLDAAWEHQRDLSPSLTAAVPTLSPAGHTRLRDAVDTRLEPYVGADGAVRVPGRALVAAADA